MRGSRPAEKRVSEDGGPGPVVQFTRDECVVEVESSLAERRSISELAEPYMRSGPRTKEADDAWRVRIDTSDASPANGYSIDCGARLAVVPRDAGAAQTALRLLRALMRWQLIGEGGIPLHGALVAHDSRGIAFLGDKKQGKTSSVLACLAASESVAYVTNDDLLVISADKRPRGLGWPRAIGIRPDVVRRYERYLGPYCQQVSHPYNDDPRINPDAVTFFYPSEVANAFQRRIATAAELRLLVFPSFYSTHGLRARARSLSQDEVERRLWHLTSATADEKLAGLNACFKSARTTRAQHGIWKVASAIPAIELQQSFDGLEDGAEIVLDRLAHVSR